MAQELGVDQARLGLWLWRLFVLPPASPEQLAADPVRRIGAWLGLQLAQRLAVPAHATPAIWLWRLLVLPADAPRPPWLPRWLSTCLRWPLDTFWRAIDAINYPLLDRGLQTLTPVLRPTNRYLRRALLLLAIAGAWLVISTPLSAGEQASLALILWLSALIASRMPSEHAPLLMIALSVVASTRYLWWRLTETMAVEGLVDHVCAWLLLCAEGYAWLILLLGFMQTAMPLRREPAPLPADPRDWPVVDVFIPSYNEPLRVVKPTVLAALGLDWPSDKLNVYILDDGRRSEFRDFAAEVGCGYIIRPDNFHAKAGNLNHALTKTNGELIAIFDCDHIPTRSFLQMAVGWFVQDKKCAMLQTPHHFFSPDPFERNLGTFREVPNEGELFYGVIQDGNDLWNATFFCGSCAVIRRGPLLEVGGIAVETVTEDAHTALKLHRLGYTTAYLNLPQAAGLATESLSGHIGQRIRWARGMAQIFRIDNPFLGRGLHWMQRVCYANAMLHFFYGIPRLIFLTAPLAYLFFEVHIIVAMTTTLALYVLPHVMVANLTNSRIQGEHRHSFWSEIYEAVLAWYIMRPTTLALLNPGLGKFNVTAKGGMIEQEYFDWTISKPYLWLLLLNMAGFALGVVRLFWWNSFEADTVLLNMIWTGVNLVILGATLGVAMEARQVRVAHRIRMRLDAVLRLGDGRTVHCHTDDFSEGGLGLTVPEGLDIAEQAPVDVALSRGDREFSFPARVVMHRGSRLGLRFERFTLQDDANLVQCTFGRADAWVRWAEHRAPDRPLAALAEILRFSAQGYRRFPRFLLEHLRQLRRQWQPQLRDHYHALLDRLFHA
ncbi:UDP-forming cellulose synthase catalytic subunit [Chitinimonas sp.]|uniref:UDP-forming cellulose synthase catalytic subunit n=1 Tax=Chitinimonas sp. TaxID=1934313 RepID=UPI0035B13685